MTGTSFCCCCLSLRQVPQMMTSLIKSFYSWNTLIQASMACLVWSLVYSAAHLASICEVSLLVLKRFNITIVATFVFPLPKKYYRETDPAPLNLMWIIFEWVRSRRRGWPAKLERTSQTEEVSCRWRNILSSTAPYIFSLSFLHCEYTKKIIFNSGLVGHLIDWKPIFLPVAKENIPKRAIFHLVSNLIWTLRCCRAHDSLAFCAYLQEP